jgi:hypothetical protein
LLIPARQPNVAVAIERRQSAREAQLPARSTRMNTKWRGANTYRSIVYDSGAMAWLGKVARTKKLITVTDAEREAADLFLQNNAILRYLNDDEWVDVQPSVAGMGLELVGARRGLRPQRRARRRVGAPRMLGCAGCADARQRGGYRPGVR